MVDASTEKQIRSMSESLAELLSERDYTGIRTAVIEYASSQHFSPKYAYFMIEQLLSHAEMADLAVELATISTEKNTARALERFSPGMGTPVKVAELNKDLLSQRGWARWKQGDVQGAQEDLKTALLYYDRYSRPTRDGKITLRATDLLRIGLTSPDSDFAWTKVREGIALDSSVLESDESYVREVTRLVHRRFGPSTDLAAVVEGILAADQVQVPEVGLVKLDGGPVSWFSEDRPTLVVFFSPLCGSCQQELRSLASTQSQLLESGRLILLLNKPELEERSLRLLDDLGLPKERAAIMSGGSAYDYIQSEPTTWIVDQSGGIAYRHVDYQPGDEEKYKERLIAIARASD